MFIEVRDVMINFNIIQDFYVLNNYIFYKYNNYYYELIDFDTGKQALAEYKRVKKLLLKE